MFSFPSLSVDSVKQWLDTYILGADPVRLAVLFSALSLILYIWYEVLLRLRRKFPYSVQCWFCHSVTQVKYIFKNCWICPSCDQYNGFTEDGDYNKDLPQLYNAEYNFSVTSIGRSKDDWYRENSLCDSCNRNQELKVKQLASYIPVSEDTYDEEIEQFTYLLEKTYKLCRNCEHLVSKILCVPLDHRTTPRRLNKGIIKTNAYKTTTKLIVITWAISLTLLLASLVHIFGRPKWLSWFEGQLYIALLPTLKKTLVAKSLLHLQPLLRFCFQDGLPTFPFISGLGLSFTLFQVLFKKTTSNLLNVGSWTALLFLSLYPYGLGGVYHYILASSGLMSLAANSIMLYHHLGYGKKKKKNPVESSPPPRAPPRSTPKEEASFDEMRRPGRPPSRKPLSRSSIKNTSAFVPAEKQFQSEDFGISGLNLGPRESLLRRKPPPKAKRSPIISPPKFNPPPKWSVGQHSLSRDSSWSSGISSLNSPERSCTPSVCGGFEPFERRDFIHRYSSPFQASLCSFPPNMSPFACYHYSTQYPHTFIPPSPPNVSQSFLNQSGNEDDHFWKALYSLPMVILILSNITLLWAVHSQAASPRV